MANITYRVTSTPTIPSNSTVKGSPLTNSEVDANFKAINDELVSLATTKQNALGFTPIQQGGGASQGNNKVYIGWHGANGQLRLQVDSTDFGGNWPINVGGNAGSATKLQTARTVTIGNTSKSFDGSANVSWSLAEIGAQTDLSFIPIRLNPRDIAADFTVPAAYNGASIGPISILDGVTVTVQNHATWSIH